MIHGAMLWCSIKNHCIVLYIHNRNTNIRTLRSKSRSSLCKAYGTNKLNNIFRDKETLKLLSASRSCPTVFSTMRWSRLLCLVAPCREGMAMIIQKLNVVIQRYLLSSVQILLSNMATLSLAKRLTFVSSFCRGNLIIVLLPSRYLQVHERRAITNEQYCTGRFFRY